MRVKFSGQIPDRYHEELRGLIKAGFKGTQDAGVEIHIKASADGDYRGYAYWGIPSMANVAKGTRWLVTLHLPRHPDKTDQHYPFIHKDPRMKTAPEMQINSYQEQILHLVAHEANHVRQYKNGRPKSEKKCEVWAAKVLQNYR